MKSKLLIFCKAWLGRFLRRLLRVPAEYLVRPQLREGCCWRRIEVLFIRPIYRHPFSPSSVTRCSGKGSGDRGKDCHRQNHLLHVKEIMLFIITAMMLS